MSTKSLARGSTFAFGSGFGLKPTMFRKDGGSLVVQRTAVFRSGTFRDSMGIQNTWEKIHMDQIISNYKHLRDNSIFDDIPVRDGHKGWLVHDLPGNGQVVGWHTNIWTEKLTAPHDGVDYDYILANLEITDPEAAAKIENGTWRNRSAEIGTYVTNAEAEFWPVYVGVAYVDMPAVEGLKFQGSGPEATDRRVYVFMDFDKETGVENETATAGQPAAPTQPLIGVTPPAASFSINGQATTDPVAVQAHITALENFQRETAQANRANFVNGLATSGRILAPQVDGLIAFCQGLTNEQFEQWKGTFESAPTNSLVANHGGGVSNPNNSAQSGQTTEDQEMQTAREVVAMHKSAGATAAQIKSTPSYKKLEAAGKAPAL